jgi:putative ABC transport system permease protein
MFRNYFKIAWRNLMKYKTFTFINIFGLSLSVSFCVLLFMYLRYEQSFDEFHLKKDRLYRLETTYLFDFSEKKLQKISSDG